MPDQDYSSIQPLNAAASKEAGSFIGYILLDMIVAVVMLWIIGTIANL
jgi:hypothetical protein